MMPNTGTWLDYVMLAGYAIVIPAFVLFFVLEYRSRKKK